MDFLSRRCRDALWKGSKDFCDVRLGGVQYKPCYDWWFPAVPYVLAVDKRCMASMAGFLTSSRAEHLMRKLYSIHYFSSTQGTCGIKSLVKYCSIVLEYTYV